MGGEKARMDGQEMEKREKKWRKRDGREREGIEEARESGRQQWMVSLEQIATFACQ